METSNRMIESENEFKKALEANNIRFFVEEVFDQVRAISFDKIKVVVVVDEEGVFTLNECNQVLKQSQYSKVDDLISKLLSIINP